MSDGAELQNVASKWWTPDLKIVAKLPRVTCRTCSDKKLTCSEHRKAKCQVCSAFISTAHIHLDYVGHADLTRTLIEIDPLWSWEPFALDGDGLPLVVQRVNQFVMWGRVTILGKTLPCVGTCDLGKSDADKELVGDLLRNAAMRFGIYGALWSKTDGWETVEGEGEAGVVREADAVLAAAAPSRPEPVAPEKPLETMTAMELAAYARKVGVQYAGTKQEMVHTLKPYAGMASGGEPFGLDGPPPTPRENEHDREFEPVVANPASQVRQEHLSGTERRGVNSATKAEK